MTSSHRIAVVEDDADILEILEYTLQREGYTVDAYARGDSALAGIQRQVPDLVLLDLMLPGVDGLEICRQLKRAPETTELPIIMLTARSEETDRVVGLELGADDYVTKPFSSREVILRIKAVLRRRDRDETRQGKSIVVGRIQLLPEAHKLLVAGEEVVLTSTEFRLLAHLMSRPGRVQSRNRLLAEVWGYAEDVDSRTVDTHIRRLRKKLGPESDRIETVIGVGYRFHS